VEDFSSAFKEMFSQVMQSYTEHDPVISLLSGGLDSSAITAMGADVLGKKNKQLMSFSSALPEASEGYDEREYINQIKAPNLNKQFIIDEMRGPFDALETFLYSPIMTSRHYLYRAFNAKAREYGAKIILDGCFGEMGPSYWGDERLAELLQKGQWLRLIQQSRSHHKLFQRSFKSMILQDMILPNLPVSWQIKLRPRKDLDYIQRFSLFKNGFVEQFISEKQQRLEADKLKHIGAKPSVDGRYNNALQLQNYLQRLGPANKEIYEPQQSEIRYVYPFRDKRVIDFCLSISNDWRYRNGYRRNIIRDGMRGMLPEAVCSRVSKEPFSPDFHNRYNRQITKAHEYIENIAAQKQQLINTIIDVPRLLDDMKRSMQSNRCYTKNDFICMHIIPSAVYLIAFLQNT
jgi:asparagine synthase (glutamine-hydrolysing)